MRQNQVATEEQNEIKEQKPVLIVDSGANQSAIGRNLWIVLNDTGDTVQCDKHQNEHE